MGRGRRAGSANDGDEHKGTWRGAPTHADQHEQPLPLRGKGLVENAEAVKLMERRVQLQTANLRSGSSSYFAFCSLDQRAGKVGYGGLRRQLSQ
jgi:hypothetical protein